jgi:hypothetical protein
MKTKIEAKNMKNTNTESGSDVIKTARWNGYRIEWCRNGYGYLALHRGGTVNGMVYNLFATFIDGEWKLEDENTELGESVRNFAMVNKPDGEWTVGAGRTLKYNGVDVAYIGRIDNVHGYNQMPTITDDLTHKIAALLNGGK